MRSAIALLRDGPRGSHMEPLVRRAAIRDVPLLVGLWHEFMSDHARIVVSRNKRLAKWIALAPNASRVMGAYFRRMMRSPNGAVFLAEEDGEPMGYALLKIDNNPPVYKLRRVGFISDLFIRKRYRGRGVSSLLKDAAFEWFRDKGLKRASLTVFSDNPHARAVYSKWGFFDYKTEMRAALQ